MMQLYKQWILRTIEDTWNLFEKKFTALWNENKDGNGDAYLLEIYNNPELQQLVQHKYMNDLLQDSLGFGAAKMIRYSHILSFFKLGFVGILFLLFFSFF